MKGSILGSRALRAACACALALGIAPAAAWGVAGEQAASDVEALREAVEDISQEGDEVTSKKGEPTPNNDADSDPADEQKPDEGADNDENGGESASAPEKSEDDSAPAGKSDTEPETQPAAAPTAQPLGEADTSSDGAAATQAATTYTLTLDSDSIDIQLYRCPVCSGGVDGDIYHCSGLEEVGYRITSSDSSKILDYWFECETPESSGHIGHSFSGNGLSGTLNPITAAPGKTTATITLVDAETSTALATASIAINGIVSTETPTFKPVANVYTVVDDERDLAIEQIFEGNTFANTLMSHGHAGENGGFITSLTIGDPAVLKCDTTHGWQSIYGLKAGTSTVTITTCTGETYTNTVTVKEWGDLDGSQLKFVQHELNLTSGEFLWNSDLFINGITGKDSAGDSFYITTSDESVLSYPFPEDESLTGDGGGIRLTACKPGTAKLNLYFYNPETEKSILADTMTVNVKAASPTASSVPGSAYAGDIVSSGAADDIVKQERLSLATSVKSPASLTADQRQGLLEATNAAEGEKAILVDISLVRPDGTAFDGYDELDSNYVFTVRLKLEGDLAGLDADTIRTYRIHKDGEMEPITCWVHDGYLYITTWHFSPYAIVGQAKSATGGNTGGVGNGSQGGNADTNDTQGGSTTTVADKGNASGTSTAKNDTAKASGATRSGAPLAQTGDSLLPLAATLGVATILGAAGLAVARRRMNRW